MSLKPVAAVLVTSAIACCTTGPVLAAAEIEWSADYRVLFDGTDAYGTGVDFVIVDAALSADGSVAAVGGYHETEDTWFVHVLPTNGGGGTVVALPVDADPNRPTMRIQDLCIDADGSRIFVITPWYQYRILKIEGGVATEILDYRDHAALSMPTDGVVRTTSDGVWVYFNEDRDDLFRVAHTGGLPERIVDDASVATANGPGWAIGDFEDGSWSDWSGVVGG